MSESFFAAVRVVVPMMLLMALGWFTRVKGMITRPAMKEFDRILFRIFMHLLQELRLITSSQSITFPEVQKHRN